MGYCFHLAVAGDVFDGVFFVLSLFSRDVLDEIWHLIESVSEGFPTDFCVGNRSFLGEKSSCNISIKTRPQAGWHFFNKLSPLLLKWQSQNNLCTKLFQT